MRAANSGLHHTFRQRVERLDLDLLAEAGIPHHMVDHAGGLSIQGLGANALFRHRSFSRM